MLTMKFLVKNLKANSNVHFNNRNLLFLRTMKKFNSKVASTIMQKEGILPNQKKIKKVKEIKPEEYTTYSTYSTKEKDEGQETLKEVDKLHKQSLMILEWPRVKYLIIPMIYFPLAMHTGLCFFDQLFLSKFTHYSFTNFLKHLMLVNCLHTGVLTGYKLTGDGDVLKYNDIYLSFAYSVGSFGIVYLLVNYSLYFSAFNVLYLSLWVMSHQILNNLSHVNSGYSRNAKVIIAVCLFLMMLLVNLNYDEYNKKISEQGKFEEVVKFYQLASDKEFKKVMNKFEEHLSEIDIKVEKFKE